MIVTAYLAMTILLMLDLSSSNTSSSESETDHNYARTKSKCSKRGALPTTQSERQGRPLNEEQNRSRSRSLTDRSRAETESAKSRNGNGLVGWAAEKVESSSRGCHTKFLSPCKAKCNRSQCWTKFR